MRHDVWVKVCGITSVRDAQMCADAGADALGLNFVPSSKRSVDVSCAQQIADAVRGRVELVIVVADERLERVLHLAQALTADWIQLHGHEGPELVAQLAPRAYKAARISSPQDVTLAAAYPGARLLVDAAVPGELGGTGTRFEWSLVAELARHRALIVAGGLKPDNVQAALTVLRPFGVDVASGVEGSQARQKDAGAVRAFVQAVRAAQGP